MFCQLLTRQPWGIELSSVPVRFRFPAKRSRNTIMAENDTKFGVKGRLLLAFFGVSALAVVGAIASLIAFAEVGSVFSRVTRESVPSTLSALELSRQAERMAAIAARLVADETIVEQMHTDGIIRKQIANLNRLFTQVKASQSNSSLMSDIENSVSEI